jgi:hypothetical protein
MDGSRLFFFPLAAAAALVSAPAPCWGSATPAGVAQEIAKAYGDAAVVLVGERHGESRSHAFFADLVEALAARGGRLLVGLELPSDRSEDLRAALEGIECPDFPVVDGPSYRELLFSLGRMAPGRVAVEAVDAGAGAAEPRDELMAHRIAAALEIGGYDQVVALVGNLHALKTIPWAQSARPPPGDRLAGILRTRGLQVASLVQWLPQHCPASPASEFHRAGTPQADAVVEALWGMLNTRPPGPGSAASAIDAALVWGCDPGSIPDG